MSISATRGYVSIGYQAAKGTAALDANKKRIKAVEEAFGVVEMADSLPIELSGQLFPDHTYKTGVYGAGSMRLIPRLGDSIAYLIHGTTGAYSVAATGTAAYKHTFKVDDTNQANLPYVTIERYVPDKTGANGFQERFSDARLASTNFTFAAAGPAICEIAAISTTSAIPVDDETGAPTVSANDAGETIGLSCAGSLTSSIPELQAAKFTAIQLMNVVQYTPPQEAQVFGSYSLDDLVPLGRTMAVRLIANLDDKALYQRMIYGGTGAVSWTPVVQSGTLAVQIASAGNMSGETIPYSLKFSAPNVKFLGGRMSLTAAKLIRLEVTAQINNSTSATPTLQYELVNKVASYTFA